MSLDVDSFLTFLHFVTNKDYLNVLFHSVANILFENALQLLQFALDVVMQITNKNDKSQSQFCRSKFHGFLGQNTTPPVHDGDPYVNAFTFESYKDLHDFLSSKERKALMAQLLPLLEATSVAQISGITCACVIVLFFGWKWLYFLRT